MARSSSKSAAKEPEKNPLLPLPRPVLEHHGQVLFRSMEQWKAQNRVPPVLLLTGPAGVGKRSVAYFLAQWLQCSRSGFSKSETQDEGGLGLSLFGEAPAPEAASENPSHSLEPCGECLSCQRALNANWVDFTEISAETEEGETGTLKIEQFRKLKSTMGFGAFDGAFRITLIRDADRMTVQAANSLLKLLEEPPPGWVLFLTASDASLLLPTLVSRCQTLRLRPFVPEALETLLEEAVPSAEKRALCARLAQGSWGRALQLAEPETWEKRGEILRFLESPSTEVSALVDWASQEPKHFELLLDQLEQLTADLVRWSEDRGSVRLDPVAQGYAANLSEKLGGTPRAREFWIDRAERLFRARQESLAPLNRKLLLQDMLLPYLLPSAPPRTLG